MTAEPVYTLPRKAKSALRTVVEHTAAGAFGFIVLCGAILFLTELFALPFNLNNYLTSQCG